MAETARSTTSPWEGAALAGEVRSLVPLAAAAQPLGHPAGRRVPALPHLREHDRHARAEGLQRGHRQARRPAAGALLLRDRDRGARRCPSSTTGFYGAYLSLEGKPNAGALPLPAQLLLPPAAGDRRRRARLPRLPRALAAGSGHDAPGRAPACPGHPGYVSFARRRRAYSSDSGVLGFYVRRGRSPARFHFGNGLNGFCWTWGIAVGERARRGRRVAELGGLRRHRGAHAPHPLDASGSRPQVFASLPGRGRAKRLSPDFEENSSWRTCCNEAALHRRRRRARRPDDGHQARRGRARRRPLLGRARSSARTRSARRAASTARSTPRARATTPDMPPRRHGATAATSSPTSRRSRACATRRRASSTCSTAWACPSTARPRGCSTSAASAARSSTAPPSPARPPASSCSTRSTSRCAATRSEGRRRASTSTGSSSAMVRDDEGVCRGIVAMTCARMEVRAFRADAVVLATGGTGSIFGRSTNSRELHRHRGRRRLPAGRALRQRRVHPGAPHRHPRRGQAPAHQRVGARRGRPASGSAIPCTGTVTCFLTQMPAAFAARRLADQPQLVLAGDGGGMDLDELAVGVERALPGRREAAAAPVQITDVGRAAEDRCRCRRWPGPPRRPGRRGSASCAGPGRRCRGRRPRRRRSAEEVPELVLA